MEKLTLRDIPSIHYRAVFGIRLDVWYLGKELFFAPSLISAEENDLFELSELVPPSSKELEDIFFMMLFVDLFEVSILLQDTFVCIRAILDLRNSRYLQWQ